MQPKRRVLAASRLCLLGIAVSASSFSVFAQCPNDTNCNAQVGSITANSQDHMALGTCRQARAAFPNRCCKLGSDPFPIFFAAGQQRSNQSTLEVQRKELGAATRRRGYTQGRDKPG
jgi:hypothetical protein